jgi:signal transduction histidine kinase/class 3 adenylate cyclase
MQIKARIWQALIAILGVIMSNEFNPLAGYESQIKKLDGLIQQALANDKVQDLIRLNTYLRRYISPLVTRDLFEQESLSVLLDQQEINTIAALVLDMRGFVQTTQSGEQTDAGLDGVANLLQMFFSEIVRIAFNNRGLVGEFAGDRVLITFGFPVIFPNSIDYDLPTKKDKRLMNIIQAVNTAFEIHQMCEILKRDVSFDIKLRQFEVGIGICSGGPAWIGNIGLINDQSRNGFSWRQELTVISTAVNIAARAEEISKDKKLKNLNRIIVDNVVINNLTNLVGRNNCSYDDLGNINVRGLKEPVRLFELIGVRNIDKLFKQNITESDLSLVNWICQYIDGSIERDTTSRVRHSLINIGQTIVSEKSWSEESIFEKMIDQIVGIFNAEKVTLYQFDDITKDLISIISRGSQPLFEPGTRIHKNAPSIAMYVAISGRSRVVNDLSTELSWGGREGKKHDQTIRSMMVVPLKIENKVIGVIQVMHDSVGKFHIGDLESLEMFAELATISLVNARTYDKEKRIANARLLITEAFSHANTLNDVLDAVMVALAKSLNARLATLYSIDRETGELLFTKVMTENDQSNLTLKRLKPGQGIVGWVVENQCSILVKDTLALSSDGLDDISVLEWKTKLATAISIYGSPMESNPPKWFKQVDSSIRSMICVPLISRSQVVGAIQVLDREPSAFDDDKLKILQWVASAAAVSIDNATRLEIASRKLIASETVAGMGAIAGKITHDLKNYITGILANSRELHHRLALIMDEDIVLKEIIDDIIDASDLAYTEINNFMRPLSDWEASYVDIGEALPELIGEIKEERSSLLEQLNINIVCRDLPCPAIVYAGRGQIKYIFHNLIDNAIEAIQAKGEPNNLPQLVQIEGYIETFNNYDWLSIIVKDTGIGIDPTNVARIFDRDFTTRPVGNIGGYGLFWVSLNVDRIGGKITVESKLGIGTEFTIRLPLGKTHHEG